MVACKTRYDKSLSTWARVMHSIRTRLFLVFSATGMVLVLLAATLYQLSFERSLVAYLQEREQQRMEEVAHRLADYYQHYGGWPSATEDPREVRRALRLPRFLILLDEQGELISGEVQEEREQRAVPIRYEEQAVGTLVYHPMQTDITDKTDKAFRQQQWHSLALTTLAALAVALLGSWVLARQLGGPLRRMAHLTQAMAQGEYGQRFQTHRRDELGLLSESINQLAHHLEEAARARDRWLADTAHELRTPLAILQGEIEALVDGIRKPEPEQLMSLQQEVVHLKRLVDDLHDLALADVGSLRYRMEAVDLAPLLEEQVRLYAHRFEEQGLQLYTQFQEPLWVEGDGTRLRQLVSNLLSNSLNYTHSPGEVRVKAWKEKQQIHLWVEDSAPNVPEEKLPHLFEHLYRAENASRNRQFGGSGLGLALVQRIAQAHKAEIQVQHSALGGLTFTLQFKEWVP